MSGPISNLANIPQSMLETLLDAVEIKMRDVSQIGGDFSLNANSNISSAITYHLQVSGQRVRAKLGLGAAWALGVNDEDAIRISACAELLHNASLIHDDIQDGDLLRRGQSTLWFVYGKNLAICSGDLLLSAAYRVLFDIRAQTALPSMLALVHERTATAISGQCADLAQLNPAQDGLEQYVKIAKAKSGALLSLPIELALLAAHQSEFTEVAKIACENFALCYQIFDDLQDLENDALREQNRQQLSAELAPVLNIIFILRTSHSRSEAIEAAFSLALKHLALCEDNAAKLPSHSGYLLLEQCTMMRSRLMAASHTVERS
jgi:geranylgeranyl pyrophosphate synthase